MVYPKFLAFEMQDSVIFRTLHARSILRFLATDTSSYGFLVKPTIKSAQNAHASIFTWRRYTQRRCRSFHLIYTQTHILLSAPCWHIKNRFASTFLRVVSLRFVTRTFKKFTNVYFSRALLIQVFEKPSGATNT